MHRTKSPVYRPWVNLLAAPMLVGCHPAPAGSPVSNAVAENTADTAPVNVAATSAPVPLPTPTGPIRCPASLGPGAGAAAGQRLLGKPAGTLPLSNALVTMNAVNDVPESLSGMAEIESENDPDENSDGGVWIAEMRASPTSALPATLICQYGAIPVGQRVSEATLLLPLPAGGSYDCTVKTPQGKDPRPATAACAPAKEE